MYRIGVDIGGTFTDFALFDARGGKMAVHKLLTTPLDPSEAVIEGIEALLQREAVAIADVSDVVHGTTLVTNAARALAPAGAAALFGGTLFSLGVGFTLTQIIGLAALALIFPAVIQMRPSAVENPEWPAELESYGKPFLAIGVGGWLLLNTDRWIVALAFDESRAGIFGLAANMSGIIPMFVAGGLMQLVFPRVFREADKAQSPADWRRLARRCDLFTLLLFLGAGAGLVVLWMAGPQLIGRLFPEKYRLSIPLFIPAGFAILASQINQFHYLLLQSKMNSDAIVRVMLATALVKVAGSIVAISISWPSYLGWLIFSPFVIACLGRLLIHRHVFPGSGKLTAGPVT